MIIVSLCSIPERILFLQEIINSILPNVDRLNVFLNNYQNIPDFLINEKIVIERSQNHSDNGDSNKFFWVDKINNAYHFICDDDIIYKKKYFDFMIKKLRFYNNKVIVSLCGSYIVVSKKNFIDYYKSRYHIHINTEQSDDLLMHIVGTGVMCYHTNHINLTLFCLPYPNMADIWLGIYAKKYNIPLVRVNYKNKMNYI